MHITLLEKIFIFSLMHLIANDIITIYIYMEVEVQDTFRLPVFQNQYKIHIGNSILCMQLC